MLSSPSVVNIVFIFKRDNVFLKEPRIRSIRLCPPVAFPRHRGKGLHVLPKGGGTQGGGLGSGLTYCLPLSLKLWALLCLSLKITI